MLLAHSFVISSPLRIMANCNCWSKCIIKAILLHAVCWPIPNIIKIFRIMGTRQPNIMRENDISCDMLITMYGVYPKNRFDFICFFIQSYLNWVVELLSDFFPFLSCCIGIDFFNFLFAHLVECNKVSILIRTTSPSYKDWS